MGVDLERGPVTTLDNKLAEEGFTDSNKMSQSIAEKTAKLHRLLGDSDKDKGFHLGNGLFADIVLVMMDFVDLESPESEKLTDSVSEKEEKDVDESEEKETNTVEQQEIEHTSVNNDIYALPIRRRQKKKEELPPGWERHEVKYYSNKPEQQS